MIRVLMLVTIIFISSCAFTVEVTHPIHVLDNTIFLGGCNAG